jgi:hypothetical protein
MRSEERLTLAEVRAELTTRRRLQGGRGKPIPQTFWAQAITLAPQGGMSAGGAVARWTTTSSEGGSRTA